MEESNNKVKTKIIGMIGTAATGVGLCVWNHGGQDMAADVTTRTVKAVAPELVKNLPEKMQGSIMNSGVDEEQVKAFSASYDDCRDEVAGNPQIDLKDISAVYDAQVACLLINKNQGATLDKMAENDDELKRTLVEIRQKNSQ